MRQDRPFLAHEHANKIILLGNASVGKTSLASRWLHDQFDPEVSPTVAAANGVKEVTIGERLVQITLWDTAGQEQFHSIAPLYIRSSSVAVIVVSADALASINAIPTWLDLLACANDHPIPALLAINKSDILDPWADAAVTQAIEMHRPNFAAVFAVSAFTGEQVGELFLEAARVACAANAGVADLIPGIISKDGPPESKCC